MKDKKLLFDRKCHVLYSKPCKKEILAKIALHYPEAERETVWEKVRMQALNKRDVSIDYAFMVTVEKFMRHGCKNVPVSLLSCSLGDFNEV